MRLIIIFVLYFNSGVFCQNLVPNPSFEEVGDNVNQNSCGHYDFSKMIKKWFAPSGSYPTVISLGNKEGFIKNPQVKTGKFGIGISTDKDIWVINGKTEYRDRGEYIGVKLHEKMSHLHTYLVSYWIRRIDCASPKKDKDELLNSNYGILLATDSIITNESNMLFGYPQIIPDSQIVVTNKRWERISKYITPNQDFQYLYLGQFTNSEHSQADNMIGYYVVDDIEILEIIDFAEIEEKTSLPIGSKIPLRNINFISGTTRFNSPKFKDILNKLISYLNDNHSIRIRINGHTDSLGNEKANKELSENRAKTIAEILIKNGISKDRIEWFGYGQEEPIKDNETYEGRTKNRRVEIEVIEYR